MKPIEQEHNFGCVVACVAFVSHISYREALELFSHGEERVNNRPNFYCPEIVEVLRVQGHEYSWQEVTQEGEGLLEKEGSIVFIKHTPNDRAGHFLARYQGLWMDSWINRPYRPIKTGFVDRLPGVPTHVIYKIDGESG
jgi:hypothetical protein